MGHEADHILHIAIWSKSSIQHKITCIAISPSFKTIITGSVDGNIGIWTFELSQQFLNLRSLLSGNETAVTSISCFDTHFVVFYDDGVLRHFELPHGDLFLSNRNTSYVHTNSAIAGESNIICSGHYADLVVINSKSLEIVAKLCSRLQSDWISCFKVSSRDRCFFVQALTVAGILKTWSCSDFTERVLLENSSGPLNVRYCRSMSFNIERRLFLLVTIDGVTVFDRSIITIFHYKSCVALEGGDFFGGKVIFWTKKGDVFEYCLDSKGSVTKIVDGRGVDCVVPLNRIVCSGDSSFFVTGDVAGCLAIYSLQPNNVNINNPIAQIKLAEVTNNTNGLLDYLNINVTCSIHVSKTNQLIAGCYDGSLLLFNAMQLLHYHFLSEQKPDFTTLLGHNKAIRCILHFKSDQNGQKDSLLLTGGDDFTVCLWDITKFELVHKFCVHSGPVIKLLRPPSDGNKKMVHAICSISADHSVAILSVRERRCLFLAAQHPFPIVAIRWKPFHDFMIIKCYDGSVFVWEVKTGVLDRVLSGVTAEEVYNCDTVDQNELWDFYTNDFCQGEMSRKPLQVESSFVDWPIRISGVMSSAHAEFNLLTINISYLISLLEASDASSPRNEVSSFKFLTKPLDSNGVQKKVADLFDIIKHEAELFQEKLHLPALKAFQKSNVSVPSENEPARMNIDLIPTGQLVLSLLHCWGKNKEVDDFYRTLGGMEPKASISTDFVSRHDITNFCSPISESTSTSGFNLVAVNSLTKTLCRVSNLTLTKNENIPSLYSSYEASEDITENVDLVSFQKLASLWSNPNHTIRSVVRRVLPSYLLRMKTDVASEMLTKWRNYLPSINGPSDWFLGKIAIVIVGLLTIDILDSDSDVVAELCTSLQYTISSQCGDKVLQSLAVDILEHGYSLFEHFLPVDIMVIPLLSMCSDETNENLRCSARNTLKTMVREQKDAFFAFLKFLCKTPHEIEEFKAELILLIQVVLTEFPTEMKTLLIDIIDILIVCIDPSHLRMKELFSLLPGIQRFDHIHHNVECQRIAIGISDGKVVVNDLRFRRSHVFQAHSAEVKVVRFSADGKLLLTINSHADVSFWQLSHGLFDLGVGQFRFRIFKSFQSLFNPCILEKGVNIAWTSSQSVLLEPVDTQLSSVAINLS